MSDVSDEIMERAENLLNSLSTACVQSCVDYCENSERQDALTIARALMGERKKALEEAAKVAEASRAAADGKFDLRVLRARQGEENLELAAACAAGMSHAAREIAAAIRKLGEEPSHHPVLKPHLPPDSFTEEELKAAIQKVTRKENE